MVVEAALFTVTGCVPLAAQAIVTGETALSPRKKKLAAKESREASAETKRAARECTTTPSSALGPPTGGSPGESGGEESPEDPPQADKAITSPIKTQPGA